VSSICQSCKQSCTGAHAAHMTLHVRLRGLLPPRFCSRSHSGTCMQVCSDKCNCHHVVMPQAIKVPAVDTGRCLMYLQSYLCQ
jgi:hypothetical protein